jgi:hypothetical protein
MNKVFMLLLAFMVPIFAQNNWGGNTFVWADSFYTTDSLKLTPAHTYLILPDTLYTEALDASDEAMNGVYKAALYMTQYAAEDSTVDSVYVDLRLGYNWGTRRSPFVQWGPWYNLLGPCVDYTLYTKNIAQSDSSWWGPSNIIQYRIYGYDEDEGTDTDSIIPYLTDFRN